MIARVKCSAQSTVPVPNQSTGQKVIEVIVELSALINNSLKPLQVYYDHYVMWSRKNEELNEHLRDYWLGMHMGECMACTVVLWLAR